MSKRKVVRDYAGNEIHVGDLINYPTRQGNRVRASDAIVRKIVVKRFNGRIYPFLNVEPMGVDSGIVPRRSYRVEEISTEHARVIIPGYDA